VKPELRAGYHDERPAPADHRPAAAQLDTVHSSIVGHVVDQFFDPFKLSKREKEAAVHLAHGMRAKDIAARMGCTEKNVYAHLARVYKKVGRRDCHEVVCALLAFACRGIVNPAFSTSRATPISEIEPISVPRSIDADVGLRRR